MVWKTKGVLYRIFGQKIQSHPLQAMTPKHNNMKKFTIGAKVTISVYTHVEANSLEEAIEIANYRPTMSIVRDGSTDSSYEWIATEIDGEPFDLKEEE